MNDELERLKYELKHWESCFEKFHNRKPTKDDLKKTSSKIQSMYKEYYKLKTVKSELGSINPEPSLHPISYGHCNVNVELLLILRISKINCDFSRLSSIIRSQIVSSSRKCSIKRSDETEITHHDLGEQTLSSKLKDWHFAKISLKDVKQLKSDVKKRNYFHLTNSENPEKCVSLSDGQIIEILNNPSIHNDFAIENQNEQSNSGSDVESDDICSITQRVLDDEPIPAETHAETSRGGLNTENFVRLNLQCKKYQRRSKFSHLHYTKQKRRNFWKRKKLDTFNGEGFISSTGRRIKFKSQNFIDAIDCYNDNQNNSIDKHEALPYDHLIPYLRERNFGVENAPFPEKEMLSIETCSNFSDWDQERLESMLDDGLRMFGYISFRAQQKRTCMKVLNGESTLLVQETGSGKSLCYQLPAMFYRQHFQSTALVISPLISLMEDQVSSLPNCIRGAYISHYMDESVKQLILKNLSDGLYDLLYVSPESLMYSAHILDLIPSVSFVCIDEAHCLSKYSHNFRPAYLFVCELIKRESGVCCFLGLTATATLPAINDILFHLNISLLHSCQPTTGGDNLPIEHFNDASHIFNIPANINFRVINTTNKNKVSIHRVEYVVLLICTTKDLMSVISKYLPTIISDSNYGNIIVYCVRRDTSESVASFLRTSLASARELNTQPHRNDIIIDHYHAGMTKQARMAVQKRFMKNKAKIVVATSAFGMGLDKFNVRVIVHYDYPLCFESFVQEIGRAGRDNMPAYSYLISDFTSLKDINEILKHVYSQSVEKFSLKKIVHSFFPGSLNPSVKPKKVFQLDIERIVQDSNQSETAIVTMFYVMKAFFTQHNYHPPQLLGFNKPSLLQMAIYGCVEDVLKVCQSEHLLRVILTESTKSATDQNAFELDIISFYCKYFINLTCWSYSNVIKLLFKTLKNQTQISYKFLNNGVVVEMFDDLSSDMMDRLIEYLFNHVKTFEKEQIISRLSLVQLFHAMSKIYDLKESNSIFIQCATAYFTSSDLQLFKQWFDDNIISKYDIDISRNPTDSHTVSKIMDSVTNLVGVYDDRKFNARSITNIFHGIDTPLFPRLIFGNDFRFWQKYLHIPYKELFSIVQAYLLKNF